MASLAYYCYLCVCNIEHLLFLILKSTNGCWRFSIVYPCPVGGGFKSYSYRLRGLFMDQPCCISSSCEPFFSRTPSDLKF